MLVIGQDCHQTVHNGLTAVLCVVNGSSVRVLNRIGSKCMEHGLAE